MYLNCNPLLFTDSYKVSHVAMEPDNQTLVYSHFTPRGTRFDNIDKVTVFGIQYFIKHYLMDEFNNRFFSFGDMAITELKQFFDEYLGPNSVDITKFQKLMDLGYLPIEIKSLPEGSQCPVGTPVLTIRNTVPGFAWLVNYIETMLQGTLWYPMTVASKMKYLRGIMDKWANLTSDNPDFVDFQLHTFSMRSCFGLDNATLADAAHLLISKGSDTLPGNLFHRKYYGADASKELISTSVPASEHNCMMALGRESELDVYKRIMNEVYPSGILSLVSDTYDLTEVINPDDGFLVRLKDEIINRDGKIVIRPDSSRKTPFEIICGDPDPHPDYNDRQRKVLQKGLVRCLDEIFGHTVNSKGYKNLDSHIGYIYGEALDESMINNICERLADMGYSSTNGVYGIGGWFHTGMLSRDSFKFAQKASYAEYKIEGNHGSAIKGINLYKDPITDDGTKKSLKGLLRVNEDYSVTQECTWEQESGGLLETVFLDGQLVKETTLSEIRERVKNYES